VTAFALPADTEGVGGRSLELLAPHAIGTLELDGAFVPDDHILGEVDKGFTVAMQTLDLFRPSVGAFAVGMAQAALDAAIEHAGGRESFGKPLREFQAVSHQLAEMAARTKAARLLVYEAAGLYDAGERVTKAAAIAKLYATETAQWVIDAALQIHGAAGLERGHLLEHLYRDVRATRIYEGTSEIQREIIARELYRDR
jgi:alkylation response protein AidB-like acyl-CoA dehydrogenase